MARTWVGRTLGGALDSNRLVGDSLRPKVKSHDCFLQGTMETARNGVTETYHVECPCEWSGLTVEECNGE